MSSINPHSTHALVFEGEGRAVPPRCSRCGETGFNVEQPCTAISDGKMYASPPKIDFDPSHSIMLDDFGPPICTQCGLFGDELKTACAGYLKSGLHTFSGDNLMGAIRNIAAAGARHHQVRFALERLDVLQGKLVVVAHLLAADKPNAVKKINDAGTLGRMKEDIDYIRAQISGIR